VADEIVLYLSENFSAEQIAAAREKVFAAHLSGITEATVVTGLTFEGSSSSYTINATASDRERFLRQCREAITLQSGHRALPANGVKLDFSTRVTST